MTSEKTRKREFDALVEASEELYCNKLLVVTNSQEGEIMWKEKNISIIPVSKF